MNKILIFIFLLSMPFFSYAEEVCTSDDIQIESIVLDSIQGNIEQTTEPVIDNNKINLGIKANVIGDSLTYKMTITNTSNKDYIFDKDLISTEYLSYNISYEDDSSIIKAGTSKIVFLNVNYNSIPEMSKLTNGVLKKENDISLNLTGNSINENEEVKSILEIITNPETKDVIIIYFIVLIVSALIIITLKKRKGIKYIVIILLLLAAVPSLAKAICSCTIDISINLEIDAKEAVFLPGQELNLKVKRIAGDNTNNYTSTNYSITSIKKSEVEPIETNKEEENVVSTGDSPYPIYMWFENGTIYWWSEDETPSLNEYAKNSFSRLNNLVEISGIKYFDTSKTKNMTDLLSSDASLLNVDELKSWNTSNVVSLRRLFFHNHSLKSVDGIENWDVRNVVDMGQVFNSCYSLEEIDLSDWETTSMENMQTTFGMWNDNSTPYTNSKLKRIIITDKFDTSKVTQMYGLFANNQNIVDYSFLELFDTSNTANIAQMFQYTNFKDLKYIKDWDVSKVEAMEGIFLYNQSIESLIGLENWDISNVTNFKMAFYNIFTLEDASAINDWNINRDASFVDMFFGTPTHPEFSKAQGTWSNGTFTPSS